MAFLSHFPANIGKNFKDRLQASNFDSEFLFDEGVLQKVLSESREDSAMSANLALSKAISLPVFGGSKATGKASTGQSSTAHTSAPKHNYRGKGRGRGTKRKQTDQNVNNAQAKDSKAPRGNSSSRGRGFTQ